MTKRISRNFSIVPSGHHKGAGEQRNKNVPDDSGVITFTSSLYFLYNNKEKKLKTKTPQSFLLGVLNCDTGLDPVKKRLNFYGWFGKASQNNPSKKFTEGDVETIFLFGGKVTKYESSKLDRFVASVERRLGDEKANAKNHRQSEKYQEALEIAKNTQIIVTAKFDNQYFSVDDEDPTRASISLGYVSFHTGRKPALQNLDPADSDEMIELTIGDKTFKGDPAETASVALSTTRSYLKDFGGSDKQNLSMYTRKEDGGQFWACTVQTFKPEELSEEFYRNFEQEMIDKILEQNYVRFSMNIKSPVDIDKIRGVEKNGDSISGNAVLVVNGQILCEDDGSSMIQFYESEPNEDGEVFKSVTFRIRQGTIYTQKLLK